MRRHLFINRSSLDGQNVRFIFVITVLFLHRVGVGGGGEGCMCENMFVYELEERGEVD